ncbi:hypothetical protein ACHAWC_007338 [Mediolabrus comicus]
MNLILLKQSEIQTTTTSSGGGGDENTKVETTSLFVNLPSKDERAKHITNHLHKKSGETVSIGIIDGMKGKAIVRHYHHNNNNNSGNNSMKEGGGGSGIRLEIQSDTLVTPQATPEITLVLAVPFPMRIKALWPVIASFTSVTRVVIVKGQLSNPEFNATKNLLPEVYHPLIEKGMMQGGHTRQLKVDVCVGDDDGIVSKQLLERLGLLCNNGDDDNSSDGGGGDDGIARLFLDCEDDEIKTSPPRAARAVVLARCCGKSSSLTTTSAPPSAIIAIGPERGWTTDEATLFTTECGFEAATLGNSILRVDTAVIAGIGIVSAALDECYELLARGEGSIIRGEEKEDVKRQRKDG